MTGTEGSPGPATDRGGNPVIDPTKNVDALVDSAVKRLDDLRTLDSEWRYRMDEREIAHAWEMREAETKRIDAILEAAAANVQRAADVQSGVAERLAAQVSGSAEVVRLALRAEVEPIQKDIADLRRVQYEGVGQKTQVTETRETRASTGMWIGLGIAAAGIAVSFVVAVASIALALYLHAHP